MIGRPTDSSHSLTLTAGAPPLLPKSLQPRVFWHHHSAVRRRRDVRRAAAAALRKSRSVLRFRRDGEPCFAHSAHRCGGFCDPRCCARGMLLVFGVVLAPDQTPAPANTDVAIRIGAARCRRAHGGRANLQNTLLSRTAVDCPNGKFRDEWISVTDRTGRSAAVGRAPSR
jgi:hypothetical protein